LQTGTKLVHQRFIGRPATAADSEFEIRDTATPAQLDEGFDESIEAFFDIYRYIDAEGGNAERGSAVTLAGGHRAELRVKGRGTARIHVG
jgi:hypothetical protein